MYFSVHYLRIGISQDFSTYWICFGLYFWFHQLPFHNLWHHLVTGFRKYMSFCY